MKPAHRRSVVACKVSNKACKGLSVDVTHRCGVVRSCHSIPGVMVGVVGGNELLIFHFFAGHFVGILPLFFSFLFLLELVFATSLGDFLGIILVY